MPGTMEHQPLLQFYAWDRIAESRTAVDWNYTSSLRKILAISVYSCENEMFLMTKTLGD